MSTITPKNICRLCLILLLLIAVLPVCTQETFVISEQVLQGAERRYGPGARQRLIAWQNLLENEKKSSEKEKLEKVNRFFNKIPYVDDMTQWGVDDYWATPVEFLASNGGDCEDYAIAKYFSLIALGIDEDKLTLTYVKALRLNEAHMVLTYYPSPKAEPLILDNLISAIKPASQRTDLLPVYSFNGSGLWLAKQRERGKQVGSSSRLKRWQEMLDRMNKEFQ